MKDKKKIIIICISLVIVVLIILGSYFIFFKDDKVLESNKKIVSKSEYIGYSYNGNYDDKNSYYIRNGNKYIVFNKETNSKITEFEMNEDNFKRIDIRNKDIVKYYVIKDDIEYKLYDLDGNLIKNSSKEIWVGNDLYNNRSYYIYDGNLYNDKDDIIYEDINSLLDITNEDNIEFYVYGSYMYCKKINDEKVSIKFIDLNNKDIIDINSFMEYGTYIKFFDYNNIIYILDLKNNKLYKYSNHIEKSFGLIVYNSEDDKKILTNNEFIEFNKKLDYYDYKFDFAVCENGFKIYSKDNKLLSDECYDDFNITFYGIVYVYNINDNSSRLYLKDNKLYTRMPVGDYYINDNTDKIVVYDNKNKEISNSCSNKFMYYRNDLYICGSDDGVYLVDKKFNKVTDNYENIVCSDEYCYFEKDGKYGLLYEDKVIIDNVYNSIYFNGNSIICDDKYTIDIFTLGDNNYLKDNELYEDFNGYKDIDVDKVIEDYELDDIREFIKGNEELFRKYAFVILNNNGLEDYKKDILNYFKIVVYNKNYLDEDIFWSSLKKLYIEINEQFLINNSFDGLFDNAGDVIYVKNNVRNSTLAHEFTHFVDWKLNEHDLFIYKYKEDYISNKDYKKLSSSEKKDAVFIKALQFNFVIEGGAEYYSSVYFKNKMVYAYPFQVQLCNMFNYIYGTEFMNKVFFDEYGHYYLFKKLIEDGFSYDDIIKFEEITNRVNDNSRTSKDKLLVFDMIIDIYEKEKDSKWYDDKVFINFIRLLMPEQIKASDTKRYDEYMKIKKLGNDVQKRIVSLVDDNYEMILEPVVTIFYEDNLYYRLLVYKKDGYKREQGYLVVNYDIINEKVKDYSFVFAE